MNTVRVYYTAPAHEAEAIGMVGLKAVPLGATEIDKIIDEQRPASLSVSRSESIRGHLLFNDQLLDNKTGILVDPKKKKAARTAAFAITIDPKKAFISDCEAYDLIAKAVEQKAPADAIRSLARAYWKKLVPGTEVVARYAVDGKSLVLQKKPENEDALPCHFSNVEVLIVGDVDPTHIHQLA